MDLKVGGGLFTSMMEVEQHQWIVIYIHTPTDIDIDAPMTTDLHVPHLNLVETKRK
jgi:hypothetical protein